MPDRAQDTEAIRAASGLKLANAANGIRGCESVWAYDHHAAYSGMKAWAEALLDERDRLVARLEADEQALRYIAGYDVAGYDAHLRSEDVARAALAAAAPGEGEA